MVSSDAFRGQTFVPIGAFSMDDVVERDNAVSGSSNVGSSRDRRRPNGHDSLSVSERRLDEDLRSISNRRRALTFEADAILLRQSCAQHGMDPLLVVENASCFEWLVNHLFSGVCASRGDLSDDSAPLVVNAACDDVSYGIHTPPYSNPLD